MSSKNKIKMRFNAIKLIIYSSTLILLSNKLNAENIKAKAVQSALNYYSDYQSVLLCEVTNVYYFQKVQNEFSTYHTYFIVVKVVESFKGNLTPGIQIGCYKYNVDDKLKLKDKYFIGHNGLTNKIFVLENDNLCSFSDIEKRQR